MSSMNNTTTTTEYICISGTTDINCPPILYDQLKLDIFLQLIIIIISFIAFLQFLITPLNKKGTLIMCRKALFISVLCEFIFAILHPISIQNYTNKVLGTISRILPWFVYFSLTIAYYLLVIRIIDSIVLFTNTIEKEKKTMIQKTANIAKKVWLCAEVILLGLMPILMLSSIISRYELIEDIFYWYQNCTVLMGAIITLAITLQIECKIISVYKQTRHINQQEFKSQIRRMNVLVFIFAMIIVMACMCNF